MGAYRQAEMFWKKKPLFINFNQLFLLLQGNRGIMGSIGAYRILESQVLVGYYLTQSLLCLFSRETRTEPLLSAVPWGIHLVRKGNPIKAEQLRECI